MKFRLNQRTLLRCAAATGVVVAVGVGVVLAEDLWVQSPSVTIRDGTDSLSQTLATAPKGTKLSLIERVDDGWVKVHAVDSDGNAVDGYVHEDALAKAEVPPDGAFEKFRANQTSGVESGMSSKGFSDQWAESKNIDTKPFKAFEAEMNAAIATQEFRDGYHAFGDEGKVGKKYRRR